MAYDFTVTRDQIIMAAFLDMGLYAPGETPTAEEFDNAALQLNMMIKYWQAAGVGLWLAKKAWLVYGPGQQSYQVGAVGDRYTLALGRSRLAQPANAGASQVVLESASGVVSGQQIGVCLSPTSIHWTTVSGVVDNTVSLATVLSADASAGRMVYFYAGAGPRPLDIIEARDVDPNGFELPVQRISYEEYMALSVKSATGRVVQFCYMPEMVAGRLYVWPVSDTVERWLEMTVRVPIQTFDTANANPEFPSEWFAALHFGLARMLSPMFGVPPERYTMIVAEAERALEAAAGFDREQDVSVRFAPDLRT